jgi:hypothetical protein
MDNEPDGMSAIEKYQVWIFFALTIIIALITSQLIFQMGLDIYHSASGSIIYILYVLCPAISAVLLVALMGGREGVLSLVMGLARWKVGLQWYIVAIVLSIIVEGLTVAIFIVTGNHIPGDYTLSPLSLTVTFYIILSAIGLAIGLGYAFSVLLSEHGPMLSAAVVGIFLVIYKGFVSIQNPNILIMSVGLFALAFILLWLYYYAKSSLLIIAIFLILFVYMSNIITYDLASMSGTSLPIYINKIIYILMTAAIMVLDMSFFREGRPLLENGNAIRPNG